MSSYLKLVVFLMLFTIVGCAVDINPGDSGISVTPKSKDFGDVIIGESVQVTLKIKNNLAETVYITDLEIEGANYKDFSIISGGDVSFSIDPGMEHDLIVSLTPTSEGLIEAKLLIHHSSDGSPYEVDFTANGLFGDNIVLVPAYYDFGNVMIGEYVESDFVLSNGTDDPITLTDISIAGLNANDYEIIAGGVVTDVQAKTTHTITVRFIPSEIGYRDGILNVYYAGGIDPLQSILVGNGVLASGFSIDPLEYDFGEVGINSTVSVDFTITNTGNTDLIISLTEIIDDLDMQFSITAGEVTSYLEITPGNSHTVTVSFSPTSLDMKTAKLRIVHSGDVDAFIGDLSGIGSDKLSISPTSHDFGSVNVGSQSSPFVFTITNPTSSDVTITSINIAGVDASAFNYSGAVPSFLPANGGSFEIEVVYIPTTNGIQVAELSVLTDFDPTPLVAQLSGEGSAKPIFTINPPCGQPYDFGLIPFNDSKTADFTVTNTGSGTLEIDVSIQNDAEGNFTIDSGGGSGIPITTGAHVIKITFSPLSIGPKTATLRIEHNATGSPCLITLVGEAATINISPTSHNFGDVMIGVVSPPTKQFTITNNTGDTVTISDVLIEGTDSASFSVSPSGYIGDLAPGSSLNVLVTCDPTKLGALSATLVVKHSFGDLKATLIANGTGTPKIQVTPSSYNYGSITLSTPIQNKTMTFEVTNVGTDVLKISSITIDGTNKEDFPIQTGGYAVDLNPGAKHLVRVKFEPNHYGQKTASIKFEHNGVSPASPYHVQLMGNATGPDFILVPDVTTYSFGDGGVGKVKRKGFYIKNGGNATLVISSIRISNQNDFQLEHANPMNIAPGGINYFYLDFTPQSKGNIGATLSISHNSVNSAREVTISGNGIAAPDEIDDDFETNPSSSGWGFTGIWEWGTPSNVEPTSAHSGSRCIGTVIDGNYPTNQHCYVISPTLDMTAAHSPKLSFYMYMYTYHSSYSPNYYNCGWIEISTDGGNTWKRNLQPSPAYNSTATINGSNINVWGGYYGDLFRNWRKIDVDLTGAAGKSGVLIAFYFHSGSYNLARPGWYIDDVKIYDTGLSYPNNTAPQDNDINTKVTTNTYTLKWDCDGASTYDVYFGQTNPPTSKVGSGIASKQHNVTVAANRKYFWYVVAKTTNSSFRSKTFYFETVSSHPTILINEIDTGTNDWIEFYNPSNSVVYIGGYECTIYSGSNSSPDGTFRIPEYLYLDPGETIVFHDSTSSPSLSNKVDFDFQWDNSAQGVEIILQKHSYYPARGVDYMKVNTLASHKPSDLSWSGAATSNRTTWYNWYRNSGTDHDTASDWTVRITSADKDAKNPGQ